MFDSRSYSQKSAHSCSRVIGEYSSCGHLESPVALASQYIGWAGIIEDLSVSCDFHPKWKVMSRRLIEMHSVFREQEVSIENRNIIISLWPRVLSRQDCAFRWLLASPICYCESGAAGKQKSTESHLISTACHTRLKLFVLSVFSDFDRRSEAIIDYEADIRGCS